MKMGQMKSSALRRFSATSRRSQGCRRLRRGRVCGYWPMIGSWECMARTPDEAESAILTRIARQRREDAEVVPCIGALGAALPGDYCQHFPQAVDESECTAC